jgi:hypothetical protein
MSTRIAITIVAVFTAILGGVSGIAGAGTANAVGPPAASPCTVVYFELSLGQGVEAFCDQAPGTYQVITQCADGLEVWSTPGSLAVAGEGPSVAECHGILLFPAYVLSYFIVQ